MSAYTLGRVLAPDQAQICEALQHRLHREDSPLVSAAIIEEFVRRISSVLDDHAHFEMLAWLSDIAASYGDIASLRGVLIDLPDALSRTVHELTGRSLQTEIDVLRDDVREVVSASWRPLQRVDEEPLDEIDARIDALIVQLETRDPLTSEHSRSVAAWCARLGRRLGFDASGVTFVSRCGLLHDIGKALTPLAVLNAPRALDDHEWAIMRAHAAAGEATVRRIPELRAFAPAVRSHHERLDGNGYPDRLPASAIPLTARIVAVADCFNAMIGRRPYRSPMSPARALEELVRNRGTQFDPEIVDAMIDVVVGERS